MMAASERHEAASAEQFVAELLRHQRACEAAGDYRQAAVAQQRIDELRSHAARRSQEALRARHVAELLAAEEHHVADILQLHDGWDAKDRELEARIAALVAAMGDRHHVELHRLRRSQPAFRPKFSKAAQEQRRLEKGLARQKNYEAAIRVKDIADRMETEESRLQLMAHNDRCAKMEANLSAQQDAEMAALLARSESGRSEHARARQHELERAIQRYLNACATIEAAQLLEKTRAQRYRVATNLPGQTPRPTASRRPSTAQTVHAEGARVA